MPWLFKCCWSIGFLLHTHPQCELWCVGWPNVPLPRNRFFFPEVVERPRTKFSRGRREKWYWYSTSGKSQPGFCECGVVLVAILTRARVQGRGGCSPGPVCDRVLFPLSSPVQPAHQMCFIDPDKQQQQQRQRRRYRRALMP